LASIPTDCEPCPGNTNASALFDMGAEYTHSAQAG